MKIFAIGILICICCLYLIVANLGSSFYVFGAYCFPIGVIIAIIGLIMSWNTER